MCSGRASQKTVLSHFEANQTSMFPVHAWQAYYESLKSTKIAQKFWNATSAGDEVSGATVFAPIDKVGSALCVVTWNC